MHNLLGRAKKNRRIAGRVVRENTMTGENNELQAEQIARQREKQKLRIAIQEEDDDARFKRRSR